MASLLVLAAVVARELSEEGCDVDDFVRTVANRYRAKMHEYKAVVIEAGVTLPVRLGLYLPSVDVFVEV